MRRKEGVGEDLERQGVAGIEVKQTWSELEKWIWEKGRVEGSRWK